MGIQAPAEVKYRLIHEAIRQDDNLLNISALCRIAGVSRSGYYAWLEAAPYRQSREESDQADFALLKEAYEFRGYKKGARSIYMRLLHLDPPVVMNLKKQHSEKEVDNTLALCYHKKCDGAVAKENTMGEKGQNTINRIKSEAMELFLQRGYKDVSMQDICNACGLSKGGLYRHFGSKAEILLSLVKDERQYDVRENIANGVPAAEILCQYLDEFYRNMLMSDSSLAFAVFEYAVTEKNVALVSEDEKDIEIWESLIAYGVSTGEFNEVNYRWIMNTLLYAYRGIRIWSRAIDIDENVPRSIIETIRHTVIKDYKEDM